MRVLSLAIGSAVLALSGMLLVVGCASPARNRLFAPCIGSDECESALCSQGICTQKCTKSDDCGAQGLCKADLCVPREVCADDTCSSSDTASVACPVTPCRLTPPQCGCPSGQACYVSGSGSACQPAGSVQNGGDCQAESDCAAGSTCITGLPTGNQCQPLCDPAVPGTCPSGYCIASGLPGLGACSADCDLVAQTGCGSRSCYAIGTSDGKFVATCGKLPGKQAQGQPCAGMQDCGPALLCASKVCRPVCHLQTGQGCTQGTCQTPQTPFIVGNTEYGVCLP